MHEGPIEYWYDTGDEPTESFDVKADGGRDGATTDAAPRHGSARRIRTRLGVSIPGAVVGTLLVCALAFGATLTATSLTNSPYDEPKDDPVALVDPTEKPDEAVDEPEVKPTDEPAADEPAIDEPVAEEPAAEPTDKPEPTARPEPKPTPKPEPKAEPKPTPKPEPKPEPTPEIVRLGIELKIREGAVFIDWTACRIPGADVYKVVRSTDSTVRWPAGENDTTIAAREVGGTTSAWDEHAKPGKRAWYRVFCLKKTDGGYRLVGKSGTASIVVPAEPKPEPRPEPQSLAIELGIQDGHVVIHWEPCSGEAFSHYRVLRKTGGEASLLAEVEDAGATTFVDETVDPGVEAHYLVQCKGHDDGGYFLLGTTEWAGIVVP